MAGAGRSGPSRLGRSAAHRSAKVPRPPNAWILYRSDKVRELPPLPHGGQRRAQGEVSKIISAMWAKEPDETRQEYEKRAEAAKIEHALEHPNYRYKPLTKEEKCAQKKLEQDQRLAHRRKGRKSNPGFDFSSPPVDPPAAPPAAPAPAPVPQYYTSATIPMNLSEFTHGSISSLPYSVTAPLEPTGPTPPLSAAGSPSDPTPSPAPSTCMDEVQSLPNTMDVNLPSVSMTPVTPSSAISTPAVSTPLFPAFNSPAFASGQEWGNASALAIEDHETFIPAPMSSSMWEVDFHQQQQQQQQQQQFEPSQGQYIATEVVSQVGCLSDHLVVCSDMKLIGESVFRPRACSFDECFCGMYGPITLRAWVVLEWCRRRSAID